MASILKCAAWSFCVTIAVGQAMAQTPTPAPLPTPIPPMLSPAPMPMPSPSLSVMPQLPPGEDQAELNELYRQIVKLYEAGRYDEAIPLSDRYIGAVEESGGADSLSYAAAISLLARLHQAKGQFDKAETLVKQALVIHERDHGRDHTDVANDLDALAQIYQSQSRLDEAEPLFRRALAINEKSQGSDPANVGRSLNNLAWLYQEQGRYEEAEPLAVKALATIKASVGATHADYGRALDTLAKLNEGLGRFSEAEALYREALTVLESALETDHESVAATRENLAGLLKSQGRLDEVEAPLKQALDTHMRVYGPEHAVVAKTLTQLGELYRLQGRSDEAEPLFERALAIRKSAIRQIPVYFATDRKKVATDKVVTFGGDRGHTLTLGEAKVIVAKPQPVAERSSLALVASLSLQPHRIAINETTDVTRLAIQSIEITADEKSIFQTARQRLESATRFPKHAFVFVHGFNVSFENAVRRAAQISYDLNFDGAPFLFSWPSRGSLWSYTSDRESAEIAVNHLKSFLELIVVQTQATHLHLIAHSMGNVVLLNALEKIKLGQPSQSTARFAEIVLHSPDVDRDRFGQLMGAIQGVASNITLYSSTSDRALGVSSWIWGAVGRAGAELAVVPGVETIDVTAAGSSLLGLNHDIYATNPAIFNDMRTVLQSGKHPPDKRSPAFEPANTDRGTYWLYRRPGETDAP
ncbi:MAG: tetratricopeptide repeat protein [Hyphomicrobium sp.]